MQEDIGMLKDEIMSEDFYSLTSTHWNLIERSSQKSKEEFKKEMLWRTLKDKDEEIQVLLSVINKLKS